MIIPEEKIKFQMPVDERGKITSGVKGGMKISGKKSLDYFRVDDFEEIVHHYGTKPESLIIFFPPGPIDSYFQFYKCEWGKNNKAKRRCNTETFQVTFKQQSKDGKELKPGIDYPCEQPNCECKYQVYFNAFISTPPPPAGEPYKPVLLNMFRKTYLFRTGSYNAGNKIYSALKMSEPNIFGQPFKLSVKAITDGENHYPLWDIEALPFHLNKQLQENNIGGLLPTRIVYTNQLESGEYLKKALPETVQQNRAIESAKEVEQDFEKALDEEVKLKDILDSIKILPNMKAFENYRAELNSRAKEFSEISREAIKSELDIQKRVLLYNLGK